MLKRVFWRARSNWSAGISMTLAGLLRVSRCFMMIQLLPLALWTKLRLHIGKLAKPTKQIGSPGSCTKGTQITQAVRSRLLRVGGRAAGGGGGSIEAVASAQRICFLRPITQ